MSHDLDFVTSADHKSLLKAIAPLGFTQGACKRLYEHPRTQWLVEFPAGPLGFGRNPVATALQLQARLCAEPQPERHASHACIRTR